LTLLARAAHGSMRDSLSLLDQAIAHGGGRVNSRPCAQCSAASSRISADILHALQKQDGAAFDRSRRAHGRTQSFIRNCAAGPGNAFASRGTGPDCAAAIAAMIRIMRQ